MKNITRFISNRIIFSFFFLLSINCAFSQYIKPLKGGERILWAANSFTAFFGPLPTAINEIYKKADPSFMPIHNVLKGKGCGLVKEYVVWSLKPDGTGVIDSIRNGNWDYVVVQTWEDATEMYDVCKDYMGCGGPKSYPKNQDTLIKYFKVLDNEIKKVNSKTILYAPHVNTYDYISQLARTKETMTKLRNQVSVPYYIPGYLSWDSVKTDYPTTNYTCKDASSTGFIKLLYSDCGHQNGNGMALDAFTWYTILSGGLSAVGLNPSFPSPMEDPSYSDYLAGVGCKIGRKILLDMGFPNDFEAPSIPNGLASSKITESSFDLTWNASTDNVGIEGYEVFLNGISFGSASTNKIIVSSLGPGLSYTVTVKSYDAAGHYSKASQAYIVTTIGTSLISDGSFETPSIGAGNYRFTPTGSPWTFTNSTGLVTNDCGFETKNIPDGNQAAVIESQGTISQNINLKAGNYSISFKASQRKNNTQKLKITIGTMTENVTALSYPNWSYHKFNFAITTDGNYSLAIKGELVNQTSFLDQFIISSSDDKTPPSKPTDLSGSNITSTGFTLNWTASIDNTGVTSYEIFQNDISIGTSTTNSKNITGLASTTSYSYKVVAKDAMGNVSVASSVYILDRQAPTVPTNLSHKALTDVSFVLTWTASTDNVAVSLYSVYRNDTLYGTVPGIYNEMPIPWCKPSTTYSMKVTATDNAGNISNVSSSISVKTKDTGTSIIDQSHDETLIYPNPADELVNINLDNIGEKTNIFILDLTGKVVYKNEITNNTHLTITTKSFAKGVYIVSVQNSIKTINTKLIIK